MKNSSNSPTLSRRSRSTCKSLRWSPGIKGNCSATPPLPFSSTSLSSSASSLNCEGKNTVVSYTVFCRHASLTIVQGRFLKAMVEIKPLSDALKDLKQISSRHQEAIIAGTLEVVMNIQASDEIERIRKWLNFDTVDSSQRMSSLLNDRAKGTGLWFFKNRAFVDFIEGHTKMLSIQGKGMALARPEILSLTS